MIYLHKLLPLLVSPLALVMLLMLWGVLRRSRGPMIAALAVLWIFSTPVVSNALWRAVEGHTVRTHAASLPQADAIVILSGMLLSPPAEDPAIFEWGDPDRFFGGLEALAAGKAPVLVFTGGKLPCHQSARCSPAMWRTPNKRQRRFERYCPPSSRKSSS
jgi:hypothetical protein